MRLSGAVAICALLSVACGGGGGGDGGTGVPVVTTLALSPGVIDTLFARGMTVQLSVQAKDGGGNVVNNPSLSFTSGSVAVATVSPSGLITSQDNGKTSITVASGSVSQSVEVKVRRRVASVTVAPATRSLTPNQTQALTVRALDALNQEITGAATPTFASSNTGVATVDAAGTVTAVAVGTATITATVVTVDGTRTATSAITVGIQNFPNAESVTINNNNFAPQVVNIAVNGSVTWNNTAAQPHNVTFASLAANNISSHSSGSTTRTFGTAGTFEYECTLHGGMTGTVIVH